ncbi:uncharacterized protein LOC117899112 [Drosophila subobscura]|uniref:uncharacterized protein LOC117899112 n=1 Tax=Drosophila subobscura TaxID=7241 RepID=UPI00155A20C4|nr:uncharacterized protein LOC117899112 [Drosophila subobscura]
MNAIVTPLVIGLAFGLGLLLIENASGLALLDKTIYSVGLFGRRILITPGPNEKTTKRASASTASDPFRTTTTATVTATATVTVTATKASALNSSSPKPREGTSKILQLHDQLMPLLTNLTMEDRLEYHVNCVSYGKPCHAAENCCNKKCLTDTKKCWHI